MMFLAVTAFGLQSCGPNNQKLQEDVNKALSGRFANVTATANDGVITLSGTLNTEAERSSAESVARSVNNVKSVINNISVNQPTPNPQVNQVNMDSTMKSAIDSRLSASGFNNVRVDVMDGEVILNGELNRADLQHVMQIANEQNPRRVTNNLTLR